MGISVWGDVKWSFYPYFVNNQENFHVFLKIIWKIFGV